MAKQWDDKKFKKWLSLRDQLKNAKRVKDFNQVIKIGLSIISFAKTAKFIGIMTPLFHRDVANAYFKNDNLIKALEHYLTAHSEFIEYRKTQKLSSPDDWLKVIGTLEKKINKVENTISKQK